MFLFQDVYCIRALVQNTQGNNKEVNIPVCERLEISLKIYRCATNMYIDCNFL